MTPLYTTQAFCQAVRKACIIQKLHHTNIQHVSNYHKVDAPDMAPHLQTETYI